MRRLLQWGLLVLVGSIWPAASFAGDKPPAKDCGLRRLASIDLQIGSVVLTPVVLDGVPTFMVLNLSLPVSTINLEAATDMKLVMGKAPEPFSNAPGIVTIDSVSLGATNIGKVKLLVTQGEKNTGRIAYIYRLYRDAVVAQGGL